MFTNILLVLLISCIVYLIHTLKNKTDKQPIQPIYHSNIVDLAPIKKLMDEVPNKVLETIQGSTNNLKGNLGEMIGYLKLHASYDKIIPLGNIVDFIALEFPKDGKPGKIIFIDIKTGKARLSKDQKMLKSLIDNRQIEFLKLNIDIMDPSENNSDPNQ